MNKPMVRINTGKEIIDREMTDAEYAQWQADNEASEARQIEIEQRKIARQALLDKLGITEDEAKLLLGGN